MPAKGPGERRAAVLATHLSPGRATGGAAAPAACAAAAPPAPERPEAAGTRELAQFYRAQLLDEVMPFWMGTVDRKHGGFFTCVDGAHRVYDTDKFVWLQARAVWMLSKLYNERRDAPQHTRHSWLAAAAGGAQFIRAHANDPASGDGYFSLRADGSPLVAPYNIFSDCFICMAMAQYFRASGQDWARAMALAKFRRIDERWENPKGRWSKAVGDRGFNSLGPPMIDINMCLELLESVAPAPEERAAIEGRIRRNVTTVLTVHPDEADILRENVALQPRDQDTHEGRLFNPGHALECCWFLLDACSQRGWEDECGRIVALARAALERGWDREHGGIFYFLDLRGCPPQQLEWDQKLWWVHLEALLCTLWCYKYTKDAYWWDWFRRIHQYLWEHFLDPQRGGELWGYLSRDGRLLMPLKGGKWKGCFHVPRALWYAERLLCELAAQ
eukprot:TRINITY_DN19902_c0_g1_i1.p1 TRINITY_DN19902_c0_g1~~TRINITY_DN19902_c0_g1_i1.p1  ORF type:complete len:474 (+),score=176.45 TRINITY_DN19902_c0_g1_i1:90-1424(+)